MMNIGSIISKAIKEGKWLNIKYQKNESDISYFWVEILDLDFEKKSFKVKIFNDKINLDVLTGFIYFEKILFARVIEFSDYDVPINLIKKIEANIDKCSWLNFDYYNNNVLDYYVKCNYLDNDPFQKEYCLIPGIDLNVLMKTKKYYLNEEQTKYILEKIYHYDISNNSNQKNSLCISKLSIDQNNKKYIVCYYNLVFDPDNCVLKLKEPLRFNKSFLIEGRRHSLFNYINMDVDEFINGFEKHYRKYYFLLKDNLKFGEIINECPDIFLLERDYSVDLERITESIKNKYLNNKLNVPLKAFFGNISKSNYIRRKEPSIAIYDKNININQMRVIYNALKFPITYVQGPPGTGKTQTILNVVLSSFFGNKTVLVCSSNNKPVDGILEKLKFKYNDEEVLFPYLRLGNKKEVLEATKKICALYEFKTDKVVKNNLIEKIKISADDSNKKLIELLNIQERRVLLEDYIESSQKLIRSLSKKSQMYENLMKKISDFNEELSNLPEIKNKDLLNLYKPVKSDYYLQQFLYYKSLDYINKLHKPINKRLIDICYIKDEVEKISEFNNWIENDKNFQSLIEIFPIIFSTNISSSRLGGNNFQFDLVVMDESSQCNIAHSLIPISKANSLLLVGDPNQLKPVIILENSINDDLMNKFNIPSSYNYVNYSILDVMRNHDNISKYILLKYHYRCGKKIIGFSNKRYYNSSLDLSNIEDEGELLFIDVKNKNVVQKNEAYDEAIAIIDYIKRNKIKDVAIITPFVNQQKLINKMLSENNLTNIHCGTIHSLQGSEKDSIILSTALSYKTSKKTYNWIKNNFALINVGVTRAKHRLVISGDLDAIKVLSNKNDDLFNLVKYVKEDGKVILPPNENLKIEIGKSNNSKNETIFFKTIAHFCSTNPEYEVKRNVPAKTIFSSSFDAEVFNKEFDLVIYQKQWNSFIPKIVIELNGGEHLNNPLREKSDNIKMKTCKRNKIAFLMIDNSFIKSYEYIKDLIMISKNKNTMQLTIDDI